MAEYRRICIECGKDFVTNNINQKTCSGKCSVKHLRDYQRAYHAKYRKTEKKGKDNESNKGGT